MSFTEKTIDAIMRDDKPAERIDDLIYVLAGAFQIAEATAQQKSSLARNLSRLMTRDEAIESRLEFYVSFFIGVIDQSDDEQFNNSLIISLLGNCKRLVKPELWKRLMSALELDTTEQHPIH